MGRQDAGLTQIDHLITTHWHNIISVPGELAKRIPSALRRSRPTVQPNPIIDEFSARPIRKLYGRRSGPCKPGTPLRLRLDCASQLGGEALKTGAGAGGANRPAPATAEGQTTRRERAMVGKSLVEIRTRASRDLT